jgi:hypothetical protein
MPETPTQASAPTPAFRVLAPDGSVALEYAPTDVQRRFHETAAPNCILEGSRGTGKSLAIRMDGHMRALAYPGLSYLVLRRSMPELRKTHLRFIGTEMGKLGGTFNKTESIAYYPNGSLGYYSHCETDDDMMRLLGGEWAVIYFDEMTTFSQEQITKIATCARVTEGSGLTALIRGGTNPIGEGAEYVHRYYILKDVPPEEDQDYDPNDYEAIHTLLADNPHIDQAQYRKKFSSQPAHYRKAWLDGEWVVEGAYFEDFQPTRDGKPWHVIPELPRIDGQWLLALPWIRIYRAVDWGWWPDPAVCIWFALLPNGRAIVFKERHWHRATAAEVAQAIKSESGGMRIAETFCDPKMFDGSEATGNSIGDLFERNGIPLTRSRNDRSASGFSIHEYLNTTLDDGLPKLQILDQGCPTLIKTLPIMRMDKNNPARIADGNDHWVISLAYFCMGGSVGPSRNPSKPEVPFWMRKAPGSRWVVGSESVKGR